MSACACFQAGQETGASYTISCSFPVNQGSLSVVRESMPTQLCTLPAVSPVSIPERRTPRHVFSLHGYIIHTITMGRLLNRKLHPADRRLRIYSNRSYIWNNQTREVVLLLRRSLLCLNI